MSRQARLALAVLGGAILIAVLMVVLRSRPEEAPRDESAPLVQSVPLARATGPLTVLGSGTVQPSEEVTIAAQISGRLIYVNPQFREGSLVGSGTTLFRIEPSDYQNRVSAAQAEVAAQAVAVMQASEEARIAKEELGRFAQRRGASDLAAQSIDSNDFASRFLRPRELEGAAGPGASSPEPPNRLATREPQLQSARAARQRALAQLADARLALGRTSVRAPFGGLVRSETAAVGKLVQPGQELGSIVSASSYEVRVSLTEREAALIPGLLESRSSRIPASIFLDYGGRKWRWSAHVDRADSILDPQTRTIDVFLRVPDPLRGGVSTVGGNAGTAPPLLLGSYVQAEILSGSDKPYFQIPVEALRPDNTIWIVTGGTLRIVRVEVLQRTDRVANVTMRVAPAKGARVVISPLRTPVDGMKVRTEQPQAKPARPKTDG